ncbi:MAG: rhomboid family intramembrane serine protease, partial [Propionibacteriaceae bacterium]|nr:rhomboid family intramembrane serine protease [Propionibacteriaceae bacterium]
MSQHGWTPPPAPHGRMAVRTPSTAPARPTLGSSLLFIGGWLALLWILEVLDLILIGALDGFGVSPRDVAELPQILTAPLLHFGFEHLMANSLPFLVLGVLTHLTGRRTFWVATAVSIVVSGLFAWLFSAPNTVTAGASGLIFGWLTFLLVRGLMNGNWKQILISVAVFGFFGGMLWGVFPTLPGVSWQGHLGGAVGGV